MKQLKRIIFLNWYLFEAEEWDIKGHVALVGKNGTGKSSFLDAIQLIMLGGSRADWKPNAKAIDRTQVRDVRGYVLGVIKDEAAIGDSKVYQPREDALCRIVLIFEDQVTGETISVGGAFAAQRSDPQAQIEGYFIAHGADLRLQDFIDDEGCVRSYADVKALLKRKTPPEGLYLFAFEPKKYMEQLMHSLGPEGRPMALPKVKRAFKQSIRLSGLEGSVSDFVKNSILDPEPLNLERVRQSIDSYRNKQEAVGKIKKQISALAEINRLYERSERDGRRRSGYAWCVEEFRFNSIEDQIDRISETLQSCWDDYRLTKQARQHNNEELARQQKQLNDCRVALQSDDSVSQQERLINQREPIRHNVRQLQEQLSKARQRIGLVSDVAKFRRHLPDEFALELDHLAGLAQAGEIGWPDDPKSVDTVVHGMRDKLLPVMSQVDEARSDIMVEAKTRTKSLAEDNQTLERLQQGGANIRNNTRILIDLLAEKGIQATPICELVEVTDPSWQPAIEAYLRNNTEALIVPPDQAKDAISVYRQAQKHTIYGATVVNTKRVQEWNDRAEPGTAAALIEGTDPNAVAYMKRLLRNIRLVNATSKFIQEDRALTQDGMFIRQAGVQKLRLPEVPILGKQAREMQIQRIEARIKETTTQLIDLNQKHGEYKRLYDNMSALKTKFEDFPSLVDLVTQLNEDLRQIENLTKQIEAIDTSHVDALKQQIKEAESKVGELNKAVNRQTGKLGTLRGQFKSENSNRHKLDQILPQIAANRRHIQDEDNDYDPQKASELYEELEEKHDLSDPDQYNEAIKKAQKRSEDARDAQQNAVAEAREKLAVYLANYPADGFMRDIKNIAIERNEVERVLQRLESTGLQERENEVSEALHKVQRVIRSELAIRLNMHIRNMKRRLSEMNSELSERPFSSNQKYEFTYRRLDEFTEFLNFIEQANEDTVSNTDSLFDEYGHIDNWIADMLDEDKGEILGDYRNYYHFDIAIKDEDAGITEMLSRKASSASGGENITPFYVAMGASLASAYRLERKPDGQVHGGVSLYLADEAFGKMDRTNTVQAASYLESIGLQLFLAAPDDAEPRLREVVDTVMFFIRDGAQAAIEIDYVKPKARELLAGTTMSGLENREFA